MVGSRGALSCCSSLSTERSSLSIQAPLSCSPGQVALTSGNWRVGSRSWEFTCGPEPWCIPPVPAASTGTEPPFTGFFRLFSLPAVLYFILTASHWQNTYRRNTVTSCLKQSRAAPMPRAWSGQGGRQDWEYQDFPALRRCQDTLQTLLPFQGISKTLECIKIWAPSQPDHCSRKHAPGAPLPIHSQNCTTLGCDQHSPAQSEHPPHPGLDGSFSKTCFPLVLSSGVGMGGTPSAGLCRGI